MSVNERLLDAVLLVQGERVAEFILPLLNNTEDWTLAQLVLTQQLPDDSDWSAFPTLVGFDPMPQLGDFDPVLWRVLTRLGREDYEWACQRIRVSARTEGTTVNMVIASLHDVLMYELRRQPKLELDRAKFEKLLKTCCAVRSNNR